MLLINAEDGYEREQRAVLRVALFELKERYNKTAEGRKFLQESIIDRHSAACLALALDECFLLGLQLWHDLI